MTARPFLDAFGAYIFHPTTHLDTMIWSSAQPENVELMGRYAFVERYDSLRAVWARDTLGLNSSEYRTSPSYLRTAALNISVSHR